jgi:hypothetical protein
LRLVWAATAAWVYALTVSIVFGYVTSWGSWEAVSACAATGAGAVLYAVFFVRLARQH